jgi:hypothetical protein
MPDDATGNVAPWLYGVEVSALQPVRSDVQDQTAAVTGLPIALVDVATGIRRVRRMVHDESEIPDYELSTAHFLNLTPGTYRIELVPWGSGQASGGSVSLSSGPTPRRHALTSARELWRRAWSRVKRSHTHQFSINAFKSAA